jgi:diguanylate cyclase (GGDEF)-like protein
VVVIVLGLLALSIITITAAATGRRAAARAHADLERSTRFDPLTGLPNRAQLEAELQARLADEAIERRGAVTVIELNRFASINETYGHEVGDGLLVAASDQLKAALAGDEKLFRSSGPQFALLNTVVADTTQAHRRADEIQAALHVPYRIGNDHLRVTTCAGIAMIERRAEDPQALMHEASVALEHSHEAGSDPSVVFAPSMQPTMTSVGAERRLREALERDEFWVLYMPVVALDNYELVGVEALLRWADPERGLVPPSEFLDMLDESGLIIPVGEWVIEQACRQSVIWQQKFPMRELVTTVNVAPRQLNRADFMDRVLAIVAETGAEPSRISLEISQGSVMREIESSWGMLRAAKDAGIKLALDDFGMGFSSLGYLRRFSLDVLKIDRTFVRDVATNREDAAIAQQLVSLAHSLGLTPVAEGVDSAEQAQTLHGLGCDFAQGYYFSPPQPVPAIDRLLERGSVQPGEAGGGEAPSIDWSGGGSAPTG